MTKLTPLLTSLKTLNITYQTPQETLLGTPETLPTSEPGTPQISYTVAAGDLPSLSITPYSEKWVAFVIGAGKVVTAATINYRMKKNGASVKTGTLSVAANYFYTIQAQFYDVAVGDVLELALWSNQTDSNWDYKAFWVQVTRIVPINKPRLLYPCNFGTVIANPTLALGNPYAMGAGTLTGYHLDVFTYSIGSAVNFESLYPKTYGLFRISRGDSTCSNDVITNTSATYRPYYMKNNVPSQIIFRGLRID